MASVVVSLVLALVLLVAALLKLAGGARARAALATYGLTGRAATAAWAALIGAEIVLAGGVAAGVEAAAWAAAALMAALTVAQAVAFASGRGGAPCACFGAGGRLGRASIARSALLAAAFATLPLLPRSEPSTDGWLAIGLGVAIAAVAALGVAVLALARELGELRLALRPDGALEIPGEGPVLNATSPLADWFDEPAGPGRTALAVFTSEGCGMCRSLAPAIDKLAHHPRVVLRTFDEVNHAGAWAAADVPGSPYAVALGADGTVLAKGTFNTPAQLESVLAAAERRMAGAGA
jgi:Methylamine utilisation protein MauE